MSMIPEPSMCYVASEPGMPGYHAAIVDAPECKREIPKDIAKWLRSGCKVTRVTTEEANVGLREYCAARKRKKDEQMNEKTGHRTPTRPGNRMRPAYSWPMIHIVPQEAGGTR